LYAADIHSAVAYEVARRWQGMPPADMLKIIDAFSRHQVSRQDSALPWAIAFAEKAILELPASELLGMLDSLVQVHFYLVLADTACLETRMGGSGWIWCASGCLKMGGSIC
jgi:hypothetical protein